MEYLWQAGRDGDPKEVHGHAHPSHHGDEQAVAGVAMGTQALLQKRQPGEILTAEREEAILLFSSRLLTRATALSVRNPDARLPMKPPTSRALM